jgi:hypothetical protein
MTLKKRLSMSKDTELSDHINVSRQMLSQMRTGSAPIPSTVLEKVLDGATFKIGSEDLIETIAAWYSNSHP